MFKFLDPADIRRLKNYEFGAKAVVEEPEELRAAILEELHAMLKQAEVRL